MRTRLSIAALAAAIVILGIRIREINAPPAPVQLAPRTVHLLYLDSLRHELLAFAEQYGRPVFVTDTIAPVTGHGRVQLARLRQALFDPRVEYNYGDKGFYIEWRTDPKPRWTAPRSFRAFGSDSYEPPKLPVSAAWPQTAAEYARLRRDFITPRWPEIPQRRANRTRRSPVPPHGDAYASMLALAATH